MRFFYTVIFYAALPFIVLRILWRAIAAPAYAQRMAERFGFFSPLRIDSTTRPNKIIWLHAVSVGEFIAALPLIKQLQTNPELQLVITTTTPTGSARVRASLGESVFHVYAPYDLPDVLARFIARVKPNLLLIMETELWPNTLAACAKNNIPTVLLNGRMSEKSARGYKKFSCITAPMLQNLSLALVQTQEDARRLQQLGLPEKNTQVTGNIKFDLSLTNELREQAAQLKKIWSANGERLVVIAASTHQGEDEIVLDAFAQVKIQLKNVLLVLVPRHPERFLSVKSLCHRRGFHSINRSNGVVDNTTEIIVGDTMGELLLLFGASDIAFVGGSLVPNGGHNFIEPAAWQLPLLSGTYLFNFVEVSRLLQDAGGLSLVHGAADLAQQLTLLVCDPSERYKRGLAAIKVADENRGALQKTLGAITKLMH